SAAGRFRRTDGGAAQDPPPGRGNAPAAAGRATPYPPRQPLAGSLAPGSSPHSSHTAARPILAGGSTAAPRLLPISFAFSAALGPHRLDQWRGRLKRRSQDVPQLRLRGRGLERRLGAERRRLKGRHRLDQLFHLLRPEDVPLGRLKGLHRSSRPPVPALDREPIGGIGRGFSPFHGPSGAKYVHVQILPLAREPEILEVNPRPEPDPILRGIGPTDQPVVPVPAPEVDKVRASPGIQQVIARPASELIIPRAAYEPIIALPALQTIVAGTAVQQIIALAPHQHIVPVLPVERIVSRAPVHRVVPGAPDEQVIPLVPVQHIVPVPATKRIVRRTSV